MDRKQVAASAAGMVLVAASLIGAVFATSGSGEVSVTEAPQGTVIVNPVGSDAQAAQDPYNEAPAAYASEEYEEHDESGEPDEFEELEEHDEYEEPEEYEEDHDEPEEEYEEDDDYEDGEEEDDDDD